MFCELGFFVRLNHITNLSCFPGYMATWVMVRNSPLALGLIIIMFCELGFFVRPSQGKTFLYLIFAKKNKDDATFHFTLGLQLRNSSLLSNSYRKRCNKFILFSGIHGNVSHGEKFSPCPWSDYDHVLWTGFLRPIKSREDSLVSHLRKKKNKDDATFHFTLGVHLRNSPLLSNSW